MDRLDQEARVLGQTAAVIGREFPARVLERVAGAERFEAGLPGLLRSGVVREVGGASGGLGGVRLEVVRGPGAGTVATSDASGSFRLAGVMGMVDITASNLAVLRTTWANFSGEIRCEDAGRTRVPVVTVLIARSLLSGSSRRVRPRRAPAGRFTRVF